MKEEILDLKSGQFYIVPESDYGKAEVWHINGVYILFGIPYLGGNPMFEDVFYEQEIDRMIEIINSWC